MSFKKIVTSDGQPVIIGSIDDDTVKFPPGFCYRIGGMIYTVKANVTQEASSPMREVVLSDGATEILPVASIILDLREPDCEILEPDQRYMPRASIKAVKKKTKKKTKKKVAKKKKNGKS